MHRPVVTPVQMGRADRATIEGGVAGVELMERAGSACRRAAVELAGGIGGRRFTVLAGPGNNGGDGFVVARQLYDAGAGVTVQVFGDPDRIRGDAAVNLERLRSRPVAVKGWDGALAPADVFVDAVFGTGFRGALDGEVAAAARLVSESGARLVSVDIPSGVQGESGAVDGAAFEADVTVAIQALKAGHVLEPGARFCGEAVVADVGIHLGEYAALLADPAAAIAAVPQRPVSSNKWAAGAVLVLGGSLGMSGAPSLAASAALRGGAGLVVAGVPASVQPTVAGYLREVMAVPLRDAAGTMDEGALEAIDARFPLDRFGAVALGPGLGRGGPVDAFVAATLASVPGPLVLDADGLNAVTPAMLHARTSPTVVTPHEGEFARLGGDLAPDRSRIEAVASAAREWGCTVLLKGPSTIVASPGRPPTVCRTGGPELATAGTGDVLTGVVAADVARGAGLHDAAVAAACMHGLAGAIASRHCRHVVAGDVSAFCGTAEAEARS